MRIGKRSKKPGFKDQAIDVDELAGMSNVEGMLSFLDTKPHEYARIFGTELSATFPSQAADSTNVNENIPGSNLLSGSNLHPDSSLPTDTDSSLLPDSRLIPGISLVPSPGAILQPDLSADKQELLQHNTSSNLLPDSDLLPTEPEPELYLPYPGSKLLPGGELRTANGRTVRIRPAKSVQDAHTPAEHMLLTAMWKKAITESSETRLLKAGLAELARWTGSHKTRCRSYLRSLGTKLAIEEAETFNAAAGKEGARVFRIFSFNAILERRRRANLTHVIRTGAVSFVDPKTGRKLLPDSKLLPGSNLLPDSSELPDTSVRPDPGSNLCAPPGSNLSSLIKKDVKEIITTSSDLIALALEQTLGHCDDDAVNRIRSACRRICSDATDEEIVYFVRQHGPRFNKMKQIANPMGMLITQLPKCFQGESFQRYRELERQRREAATAQEAELRHQWQRILDDPKSTDEDKNWARQLLAVEEPN